RSVRAARSTPSSTASRKPSGDDARISVTRATATSVSPNRDSRSGATAMRPPYSRLYGRRRAARPPPGPGARRARCAHRRRRRARRRTGRRHPGDQREHARRFHRGHRGPGGHGGAPGARPGTVLRHDRRPAACAPRGRPRGTDRHRHLLRRRPARRRRGPRRLRRRRDRRSCLRSYRTLLSGISGLALLAAIFVAGSAVGTSVAARRREIGLLRCVGYQRWWNDHAVNRFHVTLAPGADAEAVRRAIAGGVGAVEGLKVLTQRELYAYHQDAVGRAFRFTRALEVLPLIVAGLGLAEAL